ncbi:FadR/GntR family transcriptional regulator [Sphingomonas immobilis]|uniref:GntR family transcriptional regulator n=1 Tax=Sphingomonas immobilis TaxID=3063997 RepID=A0ABT8ZT85_9SPHN|nr:GntR family transcriptional regulator [Sphingomonas sp. CA1-15]MDO7840774.1 GntR family transcriptional regulator [Sphingomonas sp. CA1-15]
MTTNDPEAMPSAFAAGASKAERLADALRGDIATGRLPRGSSLPSEVEIMAQHSVSRPSYREAIRLLEAEGLVEVKRGVGGGARVLTPSMDPITSHFGVYLQTRSISMVQLFEARLTYEPSIAAGIAARRDHDALEHLARCAASQEFSIGNRPKFNEQERIFRRALIEHADNLVIRAIGLMVDDVFNRHMENISRWLPTPEYERAHLEDGVRAKHLLVRLMADGEVLRAERAWRVYIRVYLRRLINVVGRDYAIEAYPRDGG